MLLIDEEVKRTWYIHADRIMFIFQRKEENSGTGYYINELLKHYPT